MGKGIHHPHGRNELFGDHSRSVSDGPKDLLRRLAGTFVPLCTLHILSMRRSKDTVPLFRFDLGGPRSRMAALSKL